MSGKHAQLQFKLIDDGSPTYLDGCQAQFFIEDEDGYTVAFVQTIEHARLIVSAPIMFRALDALLAAADTSLDYRPEFRLAIANAHAAMALATGRNMPLTQDITESEGGEL